jgi:nuclear factor related to kappa-B-binding protein
LLKTERPSYITILCLVRDAAAKLPNGVGTRADICELLKESQYINENIPDKKIQ